MEVMNNENKKVAFHTLGCKVNQYETNAMMQEFLRYNYKIVDFTEMSDIYIINTCTVTNIADKKSRQVLRRVKEINPDSILVAVGCYAQVAKEELQKIPEIDLILGVNEKKDIINYIESFIEDNKKIIEISDVLHQKDFVDFGEVTYSEKTRAVIKVQDGCDRYCSYCLIPYARGRVRSRKPESVLKEARKIVQKGIKEIVITGIHVASYGKDFDKTQDYKLIDLLEDINKIEGLRRIRLSSIEPTIITEEFALRLSKLEKICDHFHLSLQSGCNDTLQRMNRRYTIEEFENATKILRKYYKNASLTTDIIVGFPGETEEEFNKTYEFLKKIKFYKMHIFKYSKRKGTKAAVMPLQVDGIIKEERSKKLIELSNKFEREYNRNYVGKIVEVLFEEEYINEGKKYIKGHTTNYIVTRVEQKEKNIINPNTIEIVEVFNADENELLGKHVS